MLQQKRLAAFPPTAKETNAVSPISKLYDDRLRIAFYDMGNSEGKKILVVTDRMSKDDTDHNEILSGDEATTFENVVNYAYKECENPEDVREVAVFNWEFSFLKTSANKTANDKKNIQTVNDAYYLRFKRFIKKYRPDVIVLAGIEMYEYIITKITGVSDHSNPWKITMGRIRSYKIDDVKYKIIGTLDYYRMCSWDGRYIKEFPNLLGFFARALITAFNSKNRYTAKIRTSDIDFKLIDSIKKFDIFYKRLIKQPIVGIDTEGAGLAKIKNSLYSYQFAWSTDHAYFLPLDIPDTPFSPKELVYIKKKLKHYFEFGKSKWHIYQNAKFDVTMALVQLGVRYYSHRVYDVQYGEYALDENRKLLKKYGFAKPHGPYSLSLICESYGIDIYRRIDFSKGDRGNIGAEGLTKRLIEYGCLDAIVLLWISKFQIAEAKRTGHKKFLTFVCEQMSDSSLAFTSLELRGALIDKRHLWHLRSADGPIETVIKDSKNAFRKSEAAQRVNTYLCRKKGVPVGASIFGGNVWLFDPDKQEHQQLLFFKALKLEPLSETKAGGGKVDKFFQEKYKDSCPEVKTFNEYKKNLTIRNTFINGISNKLATNPDCKLDGALRSYYDSTDVVTSRTSSKDPNLQNIPSRGPLAKPVKRLFITRPGCLICKNDYSAHEVREWANEAGDKKLASSFYEGMRYRQDMRRHAYEEPETAFEWSKIKAEKGWYDIKGADAADRKNTIIKKLKHKGVKYLAQVEYDIEVKGDVHRLNCVRFFKITVFEVTDDQRQDIKKVVFGVIYGKGAASLAIELKKDEEYAENLIEGLFREFDKGGSWIKRIEAFGQEHFFIETPIGMRRHLWGYMHTRKAVVNAMNRRGPNTILQGTASNIGVMSMRQMQHLAWHFFVKHDVPFYYQSSTNYVHDSVEAENRIHSVPIYLYLIEHASTTLIHKRLREVFDYKLTIGLEMEFQLGGSLDRCKKWDFMPDTLMTMMEKEIKFCKEELGYDNIDYTWEMNTAYKNWKIIQKIRRDELAQSLKSKAPSEIMLMNEQNARSLGLIIRE